MRSTRLRLRLKDHPREAGDSRAESRNFREGQTSSRDSHKEVGGGTHQLVAKRPQEACVVYREAGESYRLLGRLLGGDHHCQADHPGSLGPLSLGDPAVPPTMTYWCKLLHEPELIGLGSSARRKGRPGPLSDPGWYV